MAEGPSRKKVVSVAVTAIWMVFWLAGMIVAVYVLGRQAMDGEIVAVVFLVVWLGAAALGLRAAARSLVALLMRHEAPRRRPVGGRHGWSDGFPPTGRQDPGQDR